ncbi:hypothetical protein LTR86_008557 [Recurvomyces mirabilis]|nr:hypothetical protein LTR86_008557 [Recurvomyces mirabilis]
MASNEYDHLMAYIETMSKDDRAALVNLQTDDPMVVVGPFEGYATCGSLIDRSVPTQSPCSTADLGVFSTSPLQPSPFRCYDHDVQARLDVSPWAHEPSSGARSAGSSNHDHVLSTDHVDWLAHGCKLTAGAGVGQNDQLALECGSSSVPRQMRTFPYNDEGTVTMAAPTDGTFPVSQYGKVLTSAVQEQQQIMTQQPAVWVCKGVNDIPRRRQQAKSLQCGICFSNKLFKRAYEIKRHMASHFPGLFACDEPGFGMSAFTRKDKLMRHVREAHPGL